MARKAKQKTNTVLTCTVLPQPEGDDWKPLGWRMAYDIIFKKLYATAVASLEEENSQQATLSKDTPE